MSKQDLMKKVEAEVVVCTRCGLSMGRQHAVPGEGDINALVMFVGEAPGYWEDVKGRPFVGAAGKLLDEMLSRVGLSRSEVYITNILKCRPPENRDPLPIEVETCTPYLNLQIKIIEPKIIVSLGRHSTSYILLKAGFKESEGITKLRGKVYEANLLGLEVLVIPMFHPAAALYSLRYKDLLEKDFQLLRLKLEEQ